MQGTWIDIKRELCLMTLTSLWLKRNLPWRSIEMLIYSFLKFRLKKLHRHVSLFKALNQDSMRSLISNDRSLIRFQILEDFLRLFNKLLKNRMLKFENLSEVISKLYRFYDRMMLRNDCKDLNESRVQISKCARIKTSRIDWGILRSNWWAIDLMVRYLLILKSFRTILING